MAGHIGRGLHVGKGGGSPLGRGNGLSSLSRLCCHGGLGQAVVSEVALAMVGAHEGCCSKTTTTNVYAFAMPASQRAASQHPDTNMFQAGDDVWKISKHPGGDSIRLATAC